MSNMVINTNVMALNSHRNLKKVGMNQQKASSRLSSGLRINSAADDAAGLAISEKMRAQIRGLDQASKNAQDATSLIQTAEGGMQEIDNMIQRVRELVVQASNDSNDQDLGTKKSQGDRQKIQDEINQLVEEIDAMAGRVEFNNKVLLDGTYGEGGIALVEANVQPLVNDLSAGGTFGILIADVTAADIAGLNATDGALVSNVLDAVDLVNGKANADNILALHDALVALDGATLTSTNANVVALQGGAAAAQLLAETALEIDLSSISTAAGSWTVPTGTTDAAADTLAADLDAAITALTATSSVQDLREVEALMKAYKQHGSQDADHIAFAGQAEFKAVEDAIKQVYSGEGKSLYFQIGANANQGISVNINSVKTDALGIGDGNGKATFSVIKATGEDITGFIEKLDEALTVVTTQRSKLGAVQNRLEYTMNSLDISSENLSAAESRIRDADMAKEMMKLTQANVLQQAATSMLAQANQAPQSVLQLLQ